MNRIFSKYLFLATLSMPFCQGTRNYLEMSRLNQEVKESFFEKMVEFVMSKYFSYIIRSRVHTARMQLEELGPDLD